MISPHRPSFASKLSVSAIALLGWLAVYQAPIADADITRSSSYLSDAKDRLSDQDPQAAIIQLKNALNEDPDNLDARRLLGETYLELGRYPDAAKELRRAHEAIATPENSLLLGRALLGLGDAEDMLALIDQTTGADPEQVRAMTLLRAQALLSLKRIGDARIALSREIDANPLNVDIGLMDARISMAEGDRDAAKTKIGRVLEVNPESTEAWMLDATIKSGEGRYDAALEALDRLGELAPGSDRVKVMRAEILIRRAKFDDAERVVTEVLQRRPDDVAANFLLATVLSNKGELDQADATLRKIADVTRDVDQVTLLSGVVKLGIGQLAQAENLLGKYLSNTPDNLPVRRLLAGLQLKSNSPRAAIDVLRPVTGPTSNDVISLQLRSSAEIRLGNIEGARESLMRLVRLGQAPSAAQALTLISVLNDGDKRLPSNEIKLEVARVLDLMRNGEGDEALSATSTLAETHPNNPVILNLYGMTHLMALDDERSARQLFDKALTLDPSYLDAHRNLDRLDVRAARFDVLSERLEARIADGLDTEASALKLAQLHISQTRREEALSTLRTRAEAEPSSVPIRRALLSLTKQLDLKEETAIVADELLALGDAGEATAYSAVGDYFFRNGEFDAAVFAYTRLNQLQPDQPGLLIALAQSQYRAGDAEAARQSLHHVRSLQPDHQVANNSVVDLDIEQGRFDEALAFADKVQAVAPDQAARLTSKILVKKNEGGQALAVLEQALAETPSSTISRELFLLRQRLGLLDEATLGLQSWVATNPDDIAALDLLGDAYVARQEFDAALPYFERAHQLTLNDPRLMNDLSWVRHELGRPGAEELARRAYQISQNPAIGDTLGWILVQKGEVEDGLRLLREAHQGLQDNPDIRFHLAYALHRQGEADAAISMLRDLEAWPEPFMERDEALELLEQLKSS